MVHESALKHGLEEVGYVDGQNLSIEYRGTEDQYDRLPKLRLISFSGKYPSSLPSLRFITGGKGGDGGNSDCLHHWFRSS
jgi:hypothetical protein